MSGSQAGSVPGLLTGEGRTGFWATGIEICDGN